MPRAKGADYRIDDRGCWIWLRYLDADGYARVSRSKLVTEQRAAREYFRRVHGEIPAGIDIVRMCGVRACVNPGHADTVTHAEMLAEVHQDWSPLTWADVFEIRAGVKQGIKQEVFCRRHGLSSMTISRIVENKVWKDPSYKPGVEKQCARPGCCKRFTTRVSIKRYCTRRCQVTHNHRLASGYYERRAARKALARARTAVRSSIWTPDRLDAPMPGSGTWVEMVPDEIADPVAEVEAGELRRLLAGLTEETVRRMSDTTRIAVMAELAAAGYVPSARRRR